MTNTHIDIPEIENEAKKLISAADSVDSLEKAKAHFIGKNGVITEKMKLLGSLPPEQKKEFGSSINKIKSLITEIYEKKKSDLETAKINEKLQKEKIDITLPSRPENEGKIHPISHVIEEVAAIFALQGFSVAEGPDIENDYNNFTALNIPEEHPARQMHDTFYVNRKSGNMDTVLRTHTSPVQIRTLTGGKLPLRIIAPGRTYRSDSDITHSPMFHQIEAFYVDKHVTMGHLKHTVIDFLKTFFEIDDLPVRFRPSYFPFTEPSAEIDIGCSRENGELKIGKGKDWLEVMGCGMIHPKVLKNCGIDPEIYSGFALGMGVERIAMLKYNIPDLRTFFESDIRWLKHYGFNFI